ncbi:hypothetical protein BS47DRAFT_1369847, partial [Hydnum rufescens UP504]
MDAEGLDLLSTESSEGFYIAEDVCQKEADTYHGMPPKEENTEEETEGETKGKHRSDLRSANAKERRELVNSERGPRESQCVKANPEGSITYHGMPPKEENTEEETEGETKGKHRSDLWSANAKERRELHLYPTFIWLRKWSGVPKAMSSPEPQRSPAP